MITPKVYLAKSNRSNPDLVTRVRQTLSNFNIEIVEYTGGQYSHGPLNECEYLVIVPDLSNKFDFYEDDFDGVEFKLGKGLFEQINVFSYNRNVLFVIDEKLNVSEILSFDYYDTNNWYEYGVLITKKTSIERLQDVLANLFVNKQNNIILSEFCHKYLLIKRK